MGALGARERTSAMRRRWSHVVDARGYNPRRATRVPSTDPSSLASALKAEARRQGFDLAGITSPDPPPHLLTYRRWLEAGRHGDMGYLAAERALTRRADPRELLPECRSILFVGMNYLPATEPSTAGGRVAAYALGRDYHAVLPARLEAVVEWLQSEVGGPVPHRIHTDTAPILERDLAQRAGIGWIGKNTCLINPRLGSYFLLGEALLGVDLAFDPPFTTDHCGTCTRCLDACPTACILSDRTIDARRCISYLTIESRGPIPLDLRPAIGDWLFGCDVCQEVCPWNRRFARPTSDPDVRPRGKLRAPAPARLLALDRSAFGKAFKGSAVTRAKRGGLLRNAAVVAANRGDRRALPALCRALLDDEEPLVRRHAAWALGQIGGNKARSSLVQAAASEPDVRVLEEIQSSLRMIGEG